MTRTILHGVKVLEILIEMMMDIFHEKLPHWMPQG
jgi:hypothetical protein